MVETQEVPFGQWLPDQPTYRNPGLIEANNCYSSPGGYKPFEMPVASTDTTTEAVMGAQKFDRDDGGSLIVAGSSTRLLTLTGSGVTETTGFSALGPGSSWQFARFGDLVIAVSKENTTQYLTDLNSATSFVDLPGGPPQAACVGVVLDYVVMGDLMDVASTGGADVPYRVRWGAFNNPTVSWEPDRGNQSGSRDLDRKYGRITGIVGGRFGLVFQERAIWRMVRVGAPKVFDFELVTDEIGCISTGSLVTIGYETFFLDQSGFFKTNGSDIAAIGDERVNEWFGENVDVTQNQLVHGAMNWPKRSIVWTFRTEAATAFNRQLTYSIVTEQWTTADKTVNYLVQTSQDALNLGDLGTQFPGGLGTMSAFAIGALEWKARENNLGAFTPSGNGSVFSTFNGVAAQADFVTGEQVPYPGFRTHVDGLLPIVELTSGTVTTNVRSRKTQGADLRVSVDTIPDEDGFCPHHVDDWFHSYRMTLHEGAVWDKATGLWVRGKRSGRR